MLLLKSSCWEVLFEEGREGVAKRSTKLNRLLRGRLDALAHGANELSSWDQLNVEHRILDKLMDLDAAVVYGQRTLCCAADGGLSVELPAEIASSALTNQISIVSWGSNAHSFCGSPEEVAHVVRKVFKDICGVAEGRFGLFKMENFIPDSKVMRRSGGALDGCMGLEVKVPVSGLRNTAIHNSSILRVFAPFVSVLLGRCIESSMMALSDNDD